MSIRESVERASAYLTEHPAEARYRDGAATARIDAGLRAAIRGAGGELLATDMTAGIGGGASEPSPGWLFRAATASCVASLLAIRAAVLGHDVAPVEVTVDSESDDRGILGLDDAIPAGPISVRVVVALGGDLPAEARRELVDWAIAHCPVSDAIARAVPLEVEVA